MRVISCSFTNSTFAVGSHLRGKSRCAIARETTKAEKRTSIVQWKNSAPQNIDSTATCNESNENPLVQQKLTRVQTWNARTKTRAEAEN